MAKGPDNETDKRGLGEVVYSVDSESELEKRRQEDAAAVTQASRESFPASDAPGFTGVVADGDGEDEDENGNEG